MDTPNKKLIQKENEWHLQVALYHLRQIKPDHLRTAAQINQYTTTIREAEMLANHKFVDDYSDEK